MKLKLTTLDGKHQFHYLTGKRKTYNVTVTAKFSARAKIRIHGIVAYSLILSLTYAKQIHEFLASIKKMHTKENWFLFLPNGVYFYWLCYFDSFRALRCLWPATAFSGSGPNLACGLLITCEWSWGGYFLQRNRATPEHRGKLSVARVTVKAAAARVLWPATGNAGTERIAQFTWSSMPSLLRSSPMPRHRGGALQRPRIVNGWQRSFVAASALDFAILITCL